MSDDKMRAEFESWAESKCMSLTRINWKCGSVSEYAYTATFDAWQVWQAGYQAGQKAEREAIFIEWENGELLAAEVERLRAELELSKANAESLKKALHEVQNAAIRLGDQVDDAKAELAAAKAASVVPVRVVDVATGDEVFNWPGDFSNHRCVELGSQDDAKIFEAWLRDRMKERGEG